MLSAAYNTANFAGTMGRGAVNRLRGNVPPSEITAASTAANEMGLNTLFKPSWAEKSLLTASVDDSSKLGFFPKEQQPFVLPAARTLIAANNARKNYQSLLTPHAKADYDSYMNNFGGKRKRKRKTNKQNSKKCKKRTRKYRRY